LDVPCSEFEAAMQDLEKDKKRKATSMTYKSAYHPALKLCVLGLTAEVERFWSMAGPLMTKFLSSTSPLMLEIIMYLKYNSCLWNISDVIEANLWRKNQSLAAKSHINIQKKRAAKMMADVLTWDKVMNAKNGRVETVEVEGGGGGFYQ